MKPAISPKRRYPSGQIVEADTTPRITEAQKWEVALFQRMKLGATLDNFRDQLWSYPLGMMRQWAIDAKCDAEGISAIQFSAINRYVTLRNRYLRASEAPRENAASPSMIMVSSGSIKGSYESDEDQDVKDEREYAGARSAVLSYGQSGVEWVSVLGQIARDEDSGHENQDIWRSRLPAVRCAANVLARHFGMM